MDKELAEAVKALRKLFSQEVLNCIGFNMRIDENQAAG